MTDTLVNDPTTSSRSRGEVVGLAVLLGVVSLLAGLVLGWAVFGRSGFPLDGSAEAGFARDMSTHHGQAVQMSLLVAERTEDPAIRTFANDIATSQQHQSGQMFAWLRLWGLKPTSSQPPMAWMGSDHHGSTSASGDAVPMPGMASPKDLERLTAARGVDADRYFLALMIDHHRGGVEMADAVLARSDQQEVVTLARAMKAAQTGEITTMEQMLTTKS
ncbi:hypothetical protein N802_09430 [Knoellia sinensis KCTC 19936]|uniref:DUF305 domain-containing protein n=1 Tax=Knoellia sinensis KCTC 19936 TaxID=1385520 RepID=A0A0A0J3U8_9MICO|nr:DUF305 domain-containing protein [Knoellia sinensis]KGN30311.1 hypothetical protein N802_09430 [Knoellia sinensis KCTC 19936]